MRIMNCMPVSPVGEEGGDPAKAAGRMYMEPEVPKGMVGSGPVCSSPEANKFALEPDRRVDYFSGFRVSRL